MNNNTESNIESDGSTEGTSGKPPRQKRKRSDGHKTSANKPVKNYWTLTITITTFFLAALFSFVSEITSQKTNLVIAFLLLLLLIVISIIFDGIAVSVTSCSLPPLLACASRKMPGAKAAIMLVKNAEKVSNICADVIGDICGIISGACTVAIVVKLLVIFPNLNTFLITIGLSSVVAALTVGGKAYLKGIAIKNSKEMVMFVGRLLSAFQRKGKRK